ncbi:MAG: hypothetical protein HYV46_06265 [candidate division NC10 bacterium]|nr:hypothetical protein [candidate division NC10 bacterium]
MSRLIVRHITAWLVAGLAGGLVFWLVQVLTGGPTITAFMGDQIVSTGGYPKSLSGLVGWAVHLAVSLSYGFLFAVVVAALGRASFAVGTFVALLAALLLGWATAVIAPPAISVTISVLTGRGWPVELFPLNFELGLPLWNHLLFFLLNWVVQALGLRLLMSKPGQAR